MRLIFVGDVVPDVPVGRMDSSAETRVIGNLECAFYSAVNSVHISDKAYASILPADALKNVGTVGFDALSLANNHVNDAGNFDEAVEVLSKRFPNIQFFGTVDRPYAEFEHGGVHAFVIGCLEPCRSRGPRLFREEDVIKIVRRLRKKYSSNPELLIYIYPHWGKIGEYTRFPSPYQRKLAKQWIDAGANGIIGNHPHVPQGKEYYKGCPIYYSLGNYFFRGGIEPSVPASADRMVVQFENGIATELFCPPTASKGFLEACGVLNDKWTNWKWAKAVGPYYYKNSMRSWKDRLRNHKLNTWIKFIVWCLIPLNVYLLIANLSARRRSHMRCDN